jgi:hypothetical protein
MSVVVAPRPVRRGSAAGSGDRDRELERMRREIARLHGQLADLRLELALVKATAALLVDRGSQSTEP